MALRETSRGQVTYGLTPQEMKAFMKAEGTDPSQATLGTITVDVQHEGEVLQLLAKAGIKITHNTNRDELN